MTRKRKLRVLGRDELAQARGGGILLPTLGKPKDPVGAPEYEEIAFTYQHVVWN